jgi:hypothetical protein
MCNGNCDGNLISSYTQWHLHDLQFPRSLFLLLLSRRSVFFLFHRFVYCMMLMLSLVILRLIEDKSSRTVLFQDRDMCRAQTARGCDKYLRCDASNDWKYFKTESNVIAAERFIVRVVEIRMWM